MKFKKYLAVAATVLGVTCIVVGGTMSYMTEKEEVTNVFTVGDLDVGLHETEWDETTDKDGKDIYPGYTVYKNPTVKNISDTTNGAEPCYARMIVYVQDGNGNAITDQDALDLIEKTIRFDSTYTGTYEAKGAGTSLVQGKIPGYSEFDISKLPMINPKWEKDSQRSTANKWVYNYKGTMSGNEQSTLFTDIVIPTDWNQTQIEKIASGVAGSFKLKIQADAIQAAGFTDQAAAMTALDAEITAGTQQHIDRN